MKVALLVLALALTGCASQHDLESGAFDAAAIFQVVNAIH